MANGLSRQVVMRVDEATWARLEALIGRTGLSQSAAIRMLLLRALEVIEREQRDGDRE